MIENMKTKEKIYKSALELFVEKGFKKTTVRDIAKKANANSGLMHYYYKSKSFLAMEALNKIYEEIFAITSPSIDIEKEPHIFHGVMMRLHLYFLSTQINNKFYIDTLESDLFEEMALFKCLKVMKIIDKRFNQGHDDSYLLLLQSITINALRTMIMKKNTGLIDYDSETIGAMEYKIFLSFFNVPDKEIAVASEECKRLANKLYSENLQLCDIRNLSL